MKAMLKTTKEVFLLLSFLDCIGTSVSLIICGISILLCRFKPTSSYHWFIKLLRDLGAPKMLRGQLTSRYMYHFILFFCILIVLGYCIHVAFLGGVLSISVISLV